MRTIAHKIGLFTLILTLLIIAAGLAGLNSVNQLSKSLDYIRTTAWNAADGAMESTIELQSELLTTANIFAGAITETEGLQALQESETNAAEALERMISSGLMDERTVDSLRHKIEESRAIRANVLQSYQKLKTLDKETGQTISDLDTMLMRTEETIEQNMDDNALMLLPPSEIQKLWDVADATMETRIGVLMASHAASELMSGHDIPRNQATIETGLEQAQSEIRVLSEAELLEDMTFDGVDAGQAFTTNFAHLQELFQGRLETYFSYRDQKASLDAISREMRDMLAAVEEEGDAKVEGEMLHIDDAVDLAYSTVISTIVVGILVAIGAFVASLRLIANPIENVASTLNNIAENGGDLTQTIRERGNDEIAELARGFNKFMAKTRDIIEQVKLSSGQVSGQADALNDIIQQTSAGALNQKRETEQVASAVTDLISTVANVAGHAKDAARISQSANTSTSEGKDLVRETVGKIEQLALDMKQASDVIHQVQTEADNIGGVLDVIQGIAEQTNLLALNAAIEAARAGEQGRGFAVVADEVRTLASRTQESTTEIKAMIETLQSGSRNAVEVINRSHDQTGESASSAQRADDALNRIVDAIKGILEVNEQIATATNEQETTSRQIGDSAENIHGIAESTAHKAEEAMTSTHQLADRALAMTQLVSQFRT